MPEFLHTNSEMVRRVRQFNWAATPLGPIESWQQSVRTAVRICLTSSFPIVIWLGPELRIIYNDAYIPFLGEKKHPAMLGEPGRKVWGEIWDSIGPMHAEVFAGGSPYVEDFNMFFARRLPREEVYVSFSYGPILGDVGSTVVGVFCACLETTEKVVGERRLSTLRDLGAVGAQQGSAEMTCTAAAKVLSTNALDIPFAAFYLLEESGNEARRVATSLLPDDIPGFPRVHPLTKGGAGGPWPLGQVASSMQMAEIREISRTIGMFPAHPYWEEPVETAFVIPLAAPGQRRPAGFLIAGLSPRRVLDSDYRSFLELAAGQIARSIGAARVLETERSRSEALAKLDRAKTVFFSNISHEFRTPLTLMLAPLEDALAAERSPEQASRLETAHRNARRLLKLVNALLDFSRIQAGRIEASFEPTDLATKTRDLASIFRSAVEQAGLHFTVRCEQLPQPVYVDHAMWEKIVLNLLSNAFKFTFEGEIEVIVCAVGDEVQLTVRDTGIGIEAQDLPRLFERFHRIEGVKARTTEGSGIGLALVQDLVRIHKGNIRVESEVGRGTKFTVTLRFGHDHLPPDLVRSARTQITDSETTSAFFAESMGWLSGPSEGAPARTSSGFDTRILLADNNADMREYLKRMLEQRWSVEADR